MFDKPRINVLTSKGADDESMVVIILESTKSPVFCMRSETPVAVIVVITITQNMFWEIDFPFDKELYPCKEVDSQKCSKVLTLLLLYIF